LRKFVCTGVWGSLGVGEGVGVGEEVGAGVEVAGGGVEDGIGVEVAGGEVGAGVEVAGGGVEVIRAILLSDNTLTPPRELTMITLLFPSELEMVIDPDV